MPSMLVPPPQAPVATRPAPQTTGRSAGSAVRSAAFGFGRFSLAPAGRRQRISQLKQADKSSSRPPSLRGLRRRLLAERRAQRRAQLQHQLEALVQELEELRTQVATYLAVPGEERLVAASIQRGDDVVDEIIRLRQELSVLAGEEGARALRREATLRRELQGQGSGSSGSSGGGGSRDSKAFACSLGKQPKGLTLGG
ncbi:hypothetical protein ABPG77_010533 [Micractinium sp. CCAP 211/92]